MQTFTDKILKYTLIIYVPTKTCLILYLICNKVHAQRYYSQFY